MKKIYPLIIILLLTIFAGCKNFGKFVLKGDLKQKGTDTIYIVYQEPTYKLDTIIATNGKFEYKAPIDTFTIFSLIINHKYEIPVFADKGEHISIKEENNKYVIDGKGDNKKTNEIFEAIAPMKKDTAKIQKWAEDFIKNNPSSYASIFLIKNYFIQTANPDTKKINQFLHLLNGNVKDTPYMVLLQKRMEEIGKNNISNSINSISMPDVDGKYLPWNILDNKYTLITLWATWDEESKIIQDSLASVIKEFDKKKFQIISISLDYNKNEWKRSLPTKSDNWIQVCDFKAWDNYLIKQQNITTIPYNILIGPDKKIIERNIYGQKLKNKLKEKINK